jgi:hypothetical protein
LSLGANSNARSNAIIAIKNTVNGRFVKKGKRNGAPVLNAIADTTY